MVWRQLSLEAHTPRRAGMGAGAGAGQTRFGLAGQLSLDPTPRDGAGEAEDGGRRAASLLAVLENLDATMRLLFAACQGDMGGVEELRPLPTLRRPACERPSSVPSTSDSRDEEVARQLGSMENKLSERFPIGLEEQIHKWDPDKIRRFHERWYHPANATLYLAVFEHTLQENDTAPMSTASLFGAMASLFAPKLPGGLATSPTGERSPAADKIKLVKRERQTVRPPVEHKWSLPGVAQDANPPAIFQHELIQSFSINMFCKIPVNQVRTYIETCKVS
ncbi:hypothetical protein ABZP36_012447 [Zizania latifolia]